MTSPNFFNDPTERPIKFVQFLPKPILAFGESSFPVSFIFNRQPRLANFAGASVFQLNTMMTDKNSYSNNNVVQLAVGQSQVYTLSAVGLDITTASFYLNTTKSDGTMVVTEPYGLAEARQPLFDTGIYHSFTTNATTKLFNPVVKGGSPYYPSATMMLTVHRALSSGVENLTPVTVPDVGIYKTILVPGSSWGLVDVEIDVVLKWYDNPSRTVISVNPPTVELPRFGLRMYASIPSQTVEKVVVSSQVCIATALYPTNVLRSLGGTSVTLVYWGKGDDNTGLFWGREEGVEVSINGLTIQSGLETAAYVLDNPLNDLLSSSSSSISSIHSSSSTSSIIESSSDTSVSSVNSSSSSSESSISSVSLSSSSISSTLSLTSESSSVSTAAMEFSTSSSMIWNIGKSSSSSLIASVLAKYSFTSAPNVFKQIADDSGNGNLLTLGSISGGIGPPTWGSDYGISGGGFLFTADSSHANYIQSASPSWILLAKSFAFWTKIQNTGNTVVIPLCISNGFLSNAYKTEFAIQFDRTNARVTIWLKTNGLLIWEAQTTMSSITIGNWIHVAVTHNGIVPHVYINGISSALTFTVGTALNKTKWMVDLLSSSNPVDRFIIGGAPRHFSPYIAVGFSGQIDELLIWDTTLSASDIESEYLKMETMSSASFSSASSESSE